MRESIGGTWLLGFVVLFIVLFSAYLAVSINYTKAFKVKNQIINIIEENEGFTTSVGDVTSKTPEQLKSSSKTEDKIDESACPDGNLYEGGYCVKKISTTHGAYYKVTSFIKIELPLLWQSFLIPINGETKVLYFTEDDI